MTQSATCAAREVSCSRSVYRAEQYDSDLGFYYLRARYYNPLTGRFLSRDPEDGQIKVPATLHKYLYADGDPVNGQDPSGRDDDEEYDPLTATLTTEVEVGTSEFAKDLAVCLAGIGLTVYSAAEKDNFGVLAGGVVAAYGCKRSLQPYFPRPQPPPEPPPPPQPPGPPFNCPECIGPLPPSGNCPFCNPTPD